MWWNFLTWKRSDFGFVDLKFEYPTSLKVDSVALVGGLFSTIFDGLVVDGGGSDEAV